MPITRRDFVRHAVTIGGGLVVRPAISFAKPVFDRSQIRRFADSIDGRIIAPGASDYETARFVFNRAFDYHPALIVGCTTPSDVARTIDFARVYGLPLAVRAGGHSRAGLSSCDGGVVLDLSPMRHIEVDPHRRVATAQSGSLVETMDGATKPFALATPAGGCPEVGMAGFTLGGGEGLLMTMHGAGCDNLLAATIVLADGRHVETNEGSHPDLFWAIRGGGGNFGVVTSLRYRLHPVGDVLSGALIYPAGRIAELLSQFGRFNDTASDEMVPLGELLPTPRGPQFVNHICFFGEALAGQALLKPLRTPVLPESDTVRTMSYFDAQAAGFRPKPFMHFEANLFLPQLNDAACELLEAAVRSAPPRFRVLLVGILGAITRVKLQDTAFPLRQRGIELDMLCGWTTRAEKEQAVQWVKALRDSLRPFAHGLYLSQTSETGSDLVKASYGPNYLRLSQIKKTYDPDNFFKHNQNVVPV